MDRLTSTIKLPKEGEFMEVTDELLDEMKCLGDASSKEIYRRLQEYEDTGLSPKDIWRLMEQNTRITGLEVELARATELLDEIEQILKGR